MDQTRNQEEIKKQMKTNENEKTMFQNLWDTAKTILIGKFIAIQAYLKKKEKSQISLTLHLRELEKKRRTNKTQN